MTMSENATPTDDSADEVSGLPEGDLHPDAGSPDDLDPAERKLSDEAARYRVAARAAETELVVAQARIAELQRAEIERHLATKVALPSDFWLATDVTVADLLNEDGTGIDIDKVNAAADTVLQGREHWRAKLGPVGAPSAAVTGDGRYDVATGGKPTWDDVLRGKTG